MQQSRDEDRPTEKVEAVLEVIQQTSVVDRDDRQAHALRRRDELHGLTVSVRRLDSQRE